MEVQTIIQKKRITRKEKERIARIIIDHSLKLIMNSGHFVEINNIDTKPKGYIQGKLELMLTTPFNRLSGIDYLLNVWHHPHGKVFSAYWSDPNDFDIANFKRGFWINDLLRLG